MEELLDSLMRTQVDGNVSVTQTQLLLADQETLRGMVGVSLKITHSSNGKRGNRRKRAKYRLSVFFTPGREKKSPLEPKCFPPGAKAKCFFHSGQGEKESTRT